jgi:hypothetical protein
MPEPEGQLDEASPGGTRHSRRYSPFNRAPGLRRVPDEPIGRAVLSSLIFHAVLIFALVRLTDAPPEVPRPEVTFILADLAASASAAAATHLSTPKPAPIAALTEEALFSTMPLASSCKPRWAIGRFNQ